MAGTGALLLDAAGHGFDPDVQRRIWAAARMAKTLTGVSETVPGMNNLLVSFNALAVTVATMEASLRALWCLVPPETTPGRSFELPVVFGGAGGEDLDGLAQQAGLPI